MQNNIIKLSTFISCLLLISCASDDDNNNTNNSASDCSIGDYRCDDDVLQVCNEDGEWKDETNCAEQNEVCQNKSCQKIECTDWSVSAESCKISGCQDGPTGLVGDKKSGENCSDAVDCKAQLCNCLNDNTTVEWFGVVCGCDKCADKTITCEKTALNCD